MKYISDYCGFSVEVDGDWRVERRGEASGGFIHIFELPGKPVSFNVVCGDLHPDDVIDIKHRKKWAENYLKRCGYKKVEVKDYILPSLGVPVLDVKYMMEHHGLHLTVRKVEIIHKRKIYIFTFGAIPSIFVSFELFFDQAIRSFKILT